MLAACPRDLSFAASWAAAARSATGPMRTRYRSEDPEPPGNMKTEKPCALNWRSNLSALSRLAKLPSWTAQPRLAMAGFDAGAADVGRGAAVSSGTDGAALAPAAFPLAAFPPTGIALGASGGRAFGATAGSAAGAGA